MIPWHVIGIDLTHWLLGTPEKFGMPMQLEHWQEIGEWVRRIDAGGNDGADIDEFSGWLEGLGLCYGVENSYHLEIWVKDMLTWVTEKLGPAFNPETTCHYTGLALWQHPRPYPSGVWLLEYWRSDGILMRTEPLTQEQAAWIRDNWEHWQRMHAQFQAWRKKFPNS